jgi:hypothetical protein
MNPSVSEAYIAKHMADDPAKAAAEYGAQFRSDIEAFVTREIVDSCTAFGLYEVPPAPLLTYAAFIDPSGGSADSFSCAIGHVDDDVVMVDAVREVKPPFSPESVVAELATLLKSYRCFRVSGDRYAGLWPAEQFAKYGITYEPCAMPKSQIYSSALPLLNSGRIQLLDIPRLRSQLCSLERKVHRGGRDSIDHASGAHDDVANCVCGLAVLKVSNTTYTTALLQAAFGDGPPLDTDAAARERARRMRPHMSDAELARTRGPITCRGAKHGMLNLGT